MQDEGESVLFGSHVPPSLADALPILTNAESSQGVLMCLKFVLQFVKGANFTAKEFGMLVEHTGMGEADCQRAVVGLLTLVRLSVKRKFKPDVLLKEWKALQLCDDLVKALQADIVSCRAILEEGSSSHKLSLPSVDLVLWRVDVAISTSALSRALKPSIPMQLHLSDGRVRSFEMSVDQFHDLRFNVARMLKDMSDLEAHSIVFKIDD